MMPLNFFRKQRKAVSSALLMVRFKPMTKLVCKCKPFFGFLAAIRSKWPTLRNMTTRDPSTAKKARTAKGHDRFSRTTASEQSKVIKEGKSALKGESENVISGKPLGSVQEDSCSFSHGNNRSCSNGATLKRFWSQVRKSFCKERSESVQSVQIRRVIISILP